jgi:hypothetical protein
MKKFIPYQNRNFFENFPTLKGKNFFRVKKIWNFALKKIKKIFLIFF